MNMPKCRSDTKYLATKGSATGVPLRVMNVYHKTFRLEVLWCKSIYIVFFWDALYVSSFPSIN